MALRLLHLCVLQDDPVVNVLQSFSALEVLAGDDDAKLLKVALPEISQRDALMGSIRRTMESFGFDPDQTTRLANQIHATRVRSKLDCFAEYFRARGVKFSKKDLERARAMHNKMAHGSARIGKHEGGLMNMFCLAVRMGARVDLGGSNLFS
jgi:hypothetical protein